MPEHERAAQEGAKHGQCVQRCVMGEAGLHMKVTSLGKPQSRTLTLHTDLNPHGQSHAPGVCCTDWTGCGPACAASPSPAAPRTGNPLLRIGSPRHQRLAVRRLVGHVGPGFPDLVDVVEVESLLANHVGNVRQYPIGKLRLHCLQPNPSVIPCFQATREQHVCILG